MGRLLADRDSSLQETGARALQWALVGLLLSFGAPLGLVALRSLVRWEPPWVVLSTDLRTDPLVYVYVTSSTALAFSVFGAVLGRLLDTQRRLAVTDPLTGLANRRLFLTTLERELAMAEREAADVAVLLIDVDQLKRINDEGGHVAGDRALRAVAAAIRDACRRADLAARIGGDEFALLAPRTGAEEALPLANRIRSALTAVSGLPRVSVGVATRLVTGAGDSAALVRAGDEALYEAKAAGRDRVVVAGWPR